MLQDAAMVSESRDLGKGQAKCPECGAALKSKGKRSRKLKTQRNQEISLERDYAQCPKCKTGLFPLDRELGLLEGELTPQMQQSVARLGTWIAFERAAEEIRHFTGTVVSKATVHWSYKLLFATSGGSEKSGITLSQFRRQL